MCAIGVGDGKIDCEHNDDNPLPNGLMKDELITGGIIGNGLENALKGTGKNGTYTGFVISSALANGSVDKIFGKRLRLQTGTAGLMCVFVMGKP